LNPPKKEEPVAAAEQSEAEVEAETKTDDTEGATAETGEDGAKDAEEAKEPEGDSEEQVQIKDRARRLLEKLDVAV
jgi:hypothetical protein